VFENSVLSRIFGPKRGEVKGGWSKLHNEELLFAKYNYNGEIKEDEIDRACSTNEDKRTAYRILVGKPKGKRPIVRPRRRWMNNIKMVLIEIRGGGMDWINLAQDGEQWGALVNTVMKLRVP
jgi:hypothetical protein